MFSVDAVCITCKVSQRCSFKNLAVTDMYSVPVYSLKNCWVYKISKAYLLFKSIASFDFYFSILKVYEEPVFWCSGISLACLGVSTANTDMVTNVKAPFVWIPQMLLFLRNEKQFYGQFSWCWFLKQIKHGNSRGKISKMSFLFNIGSWMK